MIYEIGLRFIRQGNKRKDIEEIVDILKTYNSKNDLVKTEYITETWFAGQKITNTALNSTIALSKIIGVNK